MLRSPLTKAFLEKHGGNTEKAEESEDPLETILTTLPSSSSLGIFFRTFFEPNSEGCATLGLKSKAEAVSHPRERSESAWEALVGLAPGVKSKTSLVSNVILSVINNCAKVFELDFLAVFNCADEFYLTNRDSFVLTNDDEEELSDFKFTSIIDLAETVDASKGHACAKANKDRICVIIKSCLAALCDRYVSLCAYSMKTPFHHDSSRSGSDTEDRLDSLEGMIGKVSSDLSALSVTLANNSSLLTDKLETALNRVNENSELVALMFKHLQSSKSDVMLTSSMSKSPSVSDVRMLHSTKVEALLSPAESLAASGVGGVVSSLTTSDAKGIESVVDMSCMFVSGEKPQLARRKPQFLDSYNSLSKLIESSKGFLPRISVESVTLTKGDTTDQNRTVFKAGAATVARKIDYLPALPSSVSLTGRLSKYKIALSSHEGLPSSLSHMIKMLYEDLEELRVFSDFLPLEMDTLLEREIGRFISVMSSLWVSLIDSSDATVCISHEGIWRGLIHLFYHQYLDSFSCSERGLFQTFYPEMLCKSFDVNSAYLLRFYNWRSSQLTGSVHNYIRSSCPRCMQSKLTAVSCITPACVKLREEEATLHVFLGSNGKPQANPFKV